MADKYIKVGDHKVSVGKVYSTSEVKTGDVWIDGKPIYRRVWSGLNIQPTQANTAVQIPGVSLPNADVVIKTTLMRDSNSGSYATLTYDSSSSIGPTGDVFVYITFLAGGMNFLLMEYTKTTD